MPPRDVLLKAFLLQGCKCQLKPRMRFICMLEVILVQQRQDQSCNLTVRYIAAGQQAPSVGRQPTFQVWCLLTDGQQ